jgi:hypothetical protein
LYAASDLGYIDSERFADLMQRATVVGAMVSAFIDR